MNHLNNLYINNFAMFARCVALLAAAAMITAAAPENQSHNIFEGKLNCFSVKRDQEKERLALAISAFAFDLQRLATIEATDDHGNAILSPLSIAGVLSLLLLGSYGRTYKEISDTLGVFKDIRCSRINHETFGDVLKQIIKDNRRAQKLYLANGIFINEEFCIRPQYQSFVMAVYGADIIPINFGSRVSKEIINSWISERTLGRIENVLTSPPLPTAKLIIVNTLYFNSEWLHHFGPETTQRMLFMPNKTKPAENIAVDMMVTVADFPYIKSNEHGCHMVALPYKDGKTMFYAIMPINSMQIPLSQLILRLDNDMLESLISKLETKPVTVALPRMNLKYRTNAKNLLQLMGITSLFSPRNANLALLSSGQCEADAEEMLIFTRIEPSIKNPQTDDNDKNSWPEISNVESGDKKKRSTDYIVNPGLYVDELLHDVQLNISETGTEAAAATIAFAFKTRRGIFRADEPFLFFIRDEDTKLILFTATIYRPDPFYTIN